MTEELNWRVGRLERDFLDMKTATVTRDVFELQMRSLKESTDARFDRLEVVLNAAAETKTRTMSSFWFPLAVGFALIVAAAVFASIGAK